MNSSTIGVNNMKSSTCPSLTMAPAAVADAKVTVNKHHNEKVSDILHTMILSDLSPPQRLLVRPRWYVWSPIHHQVLKLLFLT
jgi:hypothetical protein